MILEEIILKDFRCFFGEVKIEFSDDPERNVTLIYAENGVGKTTLLNALLWCFYGSTTQRFEKKEDIVNFDARKANRNQASVEVRFTHEDRQYIARRFSKSVATSSDREFVIARLEMGNQVYLDAPDSFINRVIPKGMASHFLFDGEHAEVFLGEKQKEKIRAQVRDILGCSLLEAAIEDLNSASKYYRKQLKDISSSEDAEDLISNRELKEESIQEALNQIENLENQVKGKNTQIDDIVEKLRNSDQGKTYQKQRDDLNKDKNRALRRIDDYATEKYNWLKFFGAGLVSEKAFTDAQSLLKEKETKGQLPSPYNEEFVTNLLENKECICGSELLPGSEETNRVAKMLEQAASHTVRSRLRGINASLNKLQIERNNGPKNLQDSSRKLSGAEGDLSSIENRLGEISSKLEGINFQEIAKRESRRKDLVSEVREIERTIGRLQANVEATKTDIIALDKLIGELDVSSSQAKSVNKRITLINSLISSFEVQLEEEEKTARQVLRASVKRVLNATSRKALNLRMSDDYVISLVNEDGKPLPRSSGENQLLGLSFTAALVEFAKLRENAQHPYLLQGTVAPLVLDSPFGQLDDAYRSTTAKHIPEMSKQVVLMVSKTQGSEEVLEALGARIGKEYVLIRHNKDERGDRELETRVINGETITTSLFEEEFDGTSILEVG